MKLRKYQKDKLKKLLSKKITFEVNTGYGKNAVLNVHLNPELAERIKVIQDKIIPEFKESFDFLDTENSSSKNQQKMVEIFMDKKFGRPYPEGKIVLGSTATPKRVYNFPPTENLCHRVWNEEQKRWENADPNHVCSVKCIRSYMITSNENPPIKISLWKRFTNLFKF